MDRTTSRTTLGRATAAVLLTGCASGVFGGDDATATTGVVVADQGSSTTTPTTAPAETVASSAAPASTAGSGTAGGIVAPLPANWDLFTGEASSIGAPTGWIDLRNVLNDPAQRAEFEKNLQDQSNSAIVDQLASGALDIIDVILMDGKTAASGFGTTANVIVDTTGSIPDLETVAALAPSQLELVGGEIKDTQRLSISGVDTLVINYSIPASTGQTATGRQYYQFFGDTVITITFTALPEYVDLALWDQMVGTITLAA